MMRAKAIAFLSDLFVILSVFGAFYDSSVSSQFTNITLTISPGAIALSKLK